MTTIDVGGMPFCFSTLLTDCGSKGELGIFGAELQINMHGTKKSNKVMYSLQKIRISH